MPVHAATPAGCRPPQRRPRARLRPRLTFAAAAATDAAPVGAAATAAAAGAAGGTAAASADPAAPPPAAVLPPAGPDTLTLAVVGDLHMSPLEMGAFEEARRQLTSALCGPDGAPLPGGRVVQLGDLGDYASKPGSRACFDHAAAFLRGFAPVPYSVVTGNHDLEGFEDFGTDAANLEAWRAALGTHHHWAQRSPGGWLLLGLSTTRFREAAGSSHEVYVDDAQLGWLSATLAANRGAPTALFSHAPPQGCGLRSLAGVHVKNRCAWLNHGRPNAGAFMRLVATNPQLKLWFSGHFHLGHDHPESLSERGECLFVQTGVVGGHVTKDGASHSRLLRAGPAGYSLYTVDHARGGALRLDATRAFDRPGVELAAPGGGGGGVSAAFGGAGGGGPAASATGAGSERLAAGRGVELRVLDGALVEFDARSGAPVGLVSPRVAGRRVRLVGPDGGPARDGASAVAVELLDAATGELERVPRSPGGSFYRTFQHNKWRKYVREQAEARLAAARAAAGVDEAGIAAGVALAQAAKAAAAAGA